MQNPVWFPFEHYAQGVAVDLFQCRYGIMKLKHVYGFVLGSIKNIWKVFEFFEIISFFFVNFTSKIHKLGSLHYFVIMPCRGICESYRAKKPDYENGRYDDGQKRCSTCDIFTKWDGARRPCCGQILRTRTRNTRHRAALMQTVKRIWWHEVSSHLLKVWHGSYAQGISYWHEWHQDVLEELESWICGQDEMSAWLCHWDFGLTSLYIFRISSDLTPRWLQSQLLNC